MPKIKDLRLEARLNASQLAQKAEVSSSSISRLEKGKVPMRRLIVVKVLYALSKELGRTLKIEDVEGLKLID